MTRNKRDGEIEMEGETIDESNECDNCGEEVHEFTVYCPNCGERVDSKGFSIS